MHKKSRDGLALFGAILALVMTSAMLEICLSNISKKKPNGQQNVSGSSVSCYDPETSQSATLTYPADRDPKQIMDKLLSKLEGYTDTNLEIEVTKMRIERVVEALRSYYYFTGKIPLPGEYYIENNYFSYGRSYPANAINKLSRIGMVPFADIGLPERFAYDGWGQKIQYVVSKYYNNKITVNGYRQLNVKLALFSVDTSKFDISIDSTEYNTKQNCNLSSFSDCSLTITKCFLKNNNNICMEDISIKDTDFIIDFPESANTYYKYLRLVTESEFQEDFKNKSAKRVNASNP